MKEKYYLLHTAGMRMGDSGSYRLVSETDLKKMSNVLVGDNSCYYYLYEKVDKKKLAKELGIL